MSKVRVRFGPSPTGALHIGGVRTALYNWLFARQNGGTFILRIEDTDKTREVPGGIEQIMEALRWYGLDWDEGPEVGGDFGPYIQSQRLEFYRKYADQLVESGHAYRAYDTAERLQAMREEQQKRGVPSGYDRRHRYLTDKERADYESAGAPYVIRFAVPTEGETVIHDAVYGDVTYKNKVLDDQVLLKSDGFPTYGLANVVDDHLMEISHVFRGEDWLPSAPIHVMVYEALGWKPPVYVHLANLLGPDKKKLAKRNGDADALSFRDRGYVLEALINFLALQGWSSRDDRDIFSLDELLEKFSLGGLLNHSPITDVQKLDWYNGIYIRAFSLSELTRRCLPFLQNAGLVTLDPDQETLEYIERVIALEQERIHTLADAPELAAFFLLPDDAYEFDPKAVQKWFGHTGVGARLGAVRDGFEGLDDWNAATTEAVVRDVIARFEVKGGEVIHPVRVALSGRQTGPGLFEMIEVLGRTRTLARLDRAIGMTTA